MGAHYFTNKSIQYLINKDIKEWDIKRAGLHALYYLKKISKETFESWLKKDKHWVSVYIGNNLASTKKEQDDCIADIVERFLDVNSISEDKIISRKNDALFLFDTKIKNNQIDIFSFIAKNSYTSYYKVMGREYYYNSKKDVIDIKGIDDRFYKNHPLIPYITNIMNYYELLDKGFVKYDEVYRAVHSFRDSYCKGLLPLKCYSEIAGYENPYAVKSNITGTIIKCADIGIIDKEKDELVINGNFALFIAPLISILPKLKGGYRYKKDNQSWKRKW